jgi:hypothetical protein
MDGGLEAEMNDSPRRTRYAIMVDTVVGTAVAALVVSFFALLWTTSDSEAKPDDFQRLNGAADDGEPKSALETRRDVEKKIHERASERISQRALK